MISHRQIARTSHRYRLLLTLLFWSTPVVYALIWLFYDHLPHVWAFPESQNIRGGLTPSMRVMAFCASMIKGAVMMYGIWSLARLFRLYEAGIFFKADNVDCFKTLSGTLMWWVAAGLVVTPLITLILTMNNAPGEHVMRVSLQSADVTALFVGGVLRVIAGVMEDGRRLQDELELTV